MIIPRIDARVVEPHHFIRLGIGGFGRDPFMGIAVRACQGEIG